MEVLRPIAVILTLNAFENVIDVLNRFIYIFEKSYKIRWIYSALVVNANQKY